jgi:hypothetical protein
VVETFGIIKTTWLTAEFQRVGVAWLRYTNPDDAGVVVEVARSAAIDDSAGLCSGVVIGERASIGHCARIGYFVHIDHDVTISNFAAIGDSARIAYAVYIGATVQVAANGYVAPYARIYSDREWMTISVPGYKLATFVLFVDVLRVYSEDFKGTVDEFLLAARETYGEGTLFDRECRDAAAYVRSVLSRRDAVAYTHRLSCVCPYADESLEKAGA